MPTEIDESALTHLGLSEKEFAEKEREWVSNLRQGIGNRRTSLLNFIKALHPDQSPDQNFIRRMSWSYVQLCEEDPSFANQAQGLISKLNIKSPLPIASSNQDRYHHMHFINACLLAIIKPWAEIVYEQHTAQCYVIQNEDEPSRLEAQFALYTSLTNEIPPAYAGSTPKPKVKGGDEGVKEQLEFILKELDEIKSTLKRIEGEGR